MLKKKKAPKYNILEYTDYWCPVCGERVASQCDHYNWYTCPHCKVDLTGSKPIFRLSHAELYPDLPEYMRVFIEGAFTVSLNANDFFCPAADDEEISTSLFALYRHLVLDEGFKPEDALDSLLIWHRGCLPMGKYNKKALDKLRKLVGFKWAPNFKKEA